jgi:T5orf172 domain
VQKYLYILSNPSMPGLIKIGKTTTSPNQRMSELHSTGVPTPFVLELSVEVHDCHASERATHSALAKYRVANNREFFRTSVKAALEAMLPVIGEYKIHEVQSSHGVKEIERELHRRRLDALEAERRAEASPSYSPRSSIILDDRRVMPGGSSEGHTSRADLTRNAVNALGGGWFGLQGLRAPPVMARISAIRTLRG